VLKDEAIDKSGGKLGGRELLDLIIRKWGVAYDIQLRKNKVCATFLETTFFLLIEALTTPLTNVIAFRRRVSKHIHKRHVALFWSKIFPDGRERILRAFGGYWEIHHIG
jgi:hypothetical protein